MDRNRINTILTDKELFELCDEYNPRITREEEKTGFGYFNELFKKAVSDEILIPVLGMQGVGKSTFLNALLMDDVVLPVDAQETNCVPVEIRYSESKDLRIVLHLLDAPPVELANSVDLEQYVSEVYNPSNTKKVEYAEIYMNSPLLTDGVVLVDLPGIGSITEANARVTTDYLQRLVAAIYLLKVYQPITKTERIFIRNSIKSLGAFWFVQNRWKDDRDTQVMESIEHNTAILKELMSDMGDNNSEPQILTIKSKQAFDAKMKENQDELNDSNMQSFISELVEFKKNWRESIYFATVENLKRYFSIALKRIETLLDDATKSYDSIEEDVRKNTAASEKRRSENRRIYDDIVRDIDVFAGSTTVQLINTETGNFNNGLRSKMHQSIDFGVVDGPNLEAAFRDNANQLQENIKYNVSSAIENFSRHITNKSDLFQVDDPELGILTLGQLRSQQQFKYEKSFPVAASLLGGAAMFFLGSNPVGWVVAGVIALGLGIASIFFKDMVMNNRKNNAKREIENSIHAASNTLRTNLEAIIGEYTRSLRGAMESVIRKLDADEEGRMAQEAERLNIRKKENSEQVRTFKHHRELVADKLAELK